MSTIQLKSLVCRGAQTLLHPEIDTSEMIAWDIDTMIPKCHSRTVDIAEGKDGYTNMDEETWLSSMERMEYAIFDGKRYQRQLDKDAKATSSCRNILSEDVSRADRRRGKYITTMVDGYAVDKISMNCSEWEAVPTLAGKDTRLAGPIRAKRRELRHEQHCLTCFEGQDVSRMINCRSCPRAYHFNCLESPYRAKAKRFGGFVCPQHYCSDCGKTTTDTGGLIFRCKRCPLGSCEDCLDWDHTDLIGANLPEFELVGEASASNGYHIRCDACRELCEEHEQEKSLILEMNNKHEEHHDMQRKSHARKQWCSNRQDAPIQPKDKNIILDARVRQPPCDPSLLKLKDHNISEDTDGLNHSTLTDILLPEPGQCGYHVGIPKRPLFGECLENMRKDKNLGRIYHLLHLSEMV